MTRHPAEFFLDSFVSKVASKSKQLNQAYWLLATTGTQDAAELKAFLDIELRLLFSDASTREKIIQWSSDPHITDPLLLRQLKILSFIFKENAVSPSILAEIAQKEASLSLAYGNFRCQLEGKTYSENDIREILKNDLSPSFRKKIWETSKQIGTLLAPQILELVALRNQAAQNLGYSDYFQMQLDLQEVDEEWLFKTLNDLAQRSESAYGNALDFIAHSQCKRFQVSLEELGPWAWSDPFCQEDPLDSSQLDSLVQQLDICEASKTFYQRMGFDVTTILQRSDLFERAGKNQHAFCLHIDRQGDVRTLNNVKSTLKWLETMLHELGHAVYELGYSDQLPWLLREPPHMISTEAMALIAGRQAYYGNSLRLLLGDASPHQEALIQKADESLKRRQLIFSRWVLTMTYFERELYRNPHQDLNALWWELVCRYQKISSPPHRKNAQDWAAKYHIGLAPIYYFSYLLGELFASSIEASLQKETGSKYLTSEKAGEILQRKLFFPGNSMKWADLAKHVTGSPLNAEAWIHQFAL